MKLIKNNFRLGGIQSTLVLLNCPSALFSNKRALLLFPTISSNSVILDKKFLNFAEFPFEIFLSHFLQTSFTNFET